MYKLKKYIRYLSRRIIGIETTEEYLDKIVKRGLTVGTHFNIQKDVILDDSHCWLITIGNYVTLAPRVHILCHDASTKHALGYTKIGPVTIGDHVFIGANSIIMPSVNIGNNVIVAAGSVVTKDISDNTIVSGVPAKIIGTTSDYINSQADHLKKFPIFEVEYTLNGGITDEQKKMMLEILNKTPSKKGFVI
jgi:maltose O-acetyltransferase